ncbi:hypothetical protein ORI20_06800 [Mycobacterium sp. CVI_P3]|uniref:DUF4386 domain-containing protein n=1 Tax=Mycobacterium pinniadriaticum TaxID=2994102 RepID=A0ABT3SA67_9MYCO|nr:hypothetical protein [Mycobacterium pinniadriaticum]MCX2929973.1 hypothetical protein [Mycobacterium pinniadriaticum]MCX2936378.1 hypothetical protein [Mycobacterium pinniadriaticum]
MIVVCIIGLAVCARFVPPPAPLTSPAGIEVIFQQRTLGIRTGMMVMVLGAALLGPFFAVISVQMRRIEGPRPTLAYAQLVLGACFILEIIFPMMAIQTAAFRPGRDGAIQQTLNDMGWLTFFGVASTGFVQLVIIGIVILQDSQAVPVFPRWVGYFNIWVGFAFLPGTVMIFFKSGPFAWDGIFIFWIPFTAFFVWLLVMPFVLCRATDQETVIDEPSAPAVGPAADDAIAEFREQLATLTARMDTFGNQTTI